MPKSETRAQKFRGEDGIEARHSSYRQTLFLDSIALHFLNLETSATRLPRALLVKHPCVVGETKTHQYHHDDRRFFQKDICQQTAPSGSLDGLKGGAYATGRQMLCGQKRPRSLPVNSTVKGDHILSPHTVMYWFCLWLLRFQYSRDCQSCSVLCSKDGIVAGQSCCLGPDE